MRLEQLAFDITASAAASSAGPGTPSAGSSGSSGSSGSPTASPEGPPARPSAAPPAAPAPPVGEPDTGIATPGAAPSSGRGYPFVIELRRGGPRRRRVEGVLHEGRFVVSYPARMPTAEAEVIAHELAARVARRVSCEGIDLVARARRLARAHGLPEPAAIEWSSRQTTLWGSCTVADRRIRISQRLADVPAFVLDYVIVHELAHLVVADHSPAFHELVQRYPRAERAIGYLMAMSLAAPDGTA